LPHTEAIYLAYLFLEIYQKVRNDAPRENFQNLESLLKEQFDPVFEKTINPEHKQYLNYIVEFLTSDKKSAIIYSTHHYNVPGSFISGIICAALSSLTSSYLIPLYADGNFNAIEDLARDIYPDLQLGGKPLLYDITQEAAGYVWAVGWNPSSYIPGTLKFPAHQKWIISSMVQDNYPENTAALLSEVHFNEQMDLRTNFINWQSIGSQAVKSPIGSAQSIAHYTYLFHQKASELEVSLGSRKISAQKLSWDELLRGEIEYYINKVKEINYEAGLWLIPAEHIAHYKDAHLTQYSSWANRDCINDQLIVPQQIAKQHNLREHDQIFIQVNQEQLPFQIKIGQRISDKNLLGYAHYSPLRQALPGEFSPFNKEYYFWCSKVSIKST
jgi:hypothetical protein